MPRQFILTAGYIKVAAQCHRQSAYFSAYSSAKLAINPLTGKHGDIRIKAMTFGQKPAITR